MESKSKENCGYAAKIFLSTLKSCVKEQTQPNSKHQQIISSDYEDEQTLNKQRRTNNRKNFVFDKRDFLFPQTSKQIRKQIQLDDVALYSVTDMRTADEISDYISQLDGLNRPNLIITDATACAGGNTSSFSRKFNRVHAIEINEIRYKMLVNNLKLLECNNVDCYHDNYLNLLSKLSQDVVFIDPPWGGPSYKDQDQVELFLGEIPLDQICESLKQRTKYVVIKAPPNLNYDKFKANISGNLQVLHQFRKMLLIVIDYYHPSTSNRVLPEPLVNEPTKENLSEKKYASQSENTCVITSTYINIAENAAKYAAACYRDYIENENVYQSAYKAAIAVVRHGSDAARTAAKTVYQCAVTDMKYVHEFYEESSFVNDYLQVAADHDYYVTDATDDIDSGHGTQTGDIDHIENDIMYNINVPAACKATLDEDDF